MPTKERKDPASRDETLKTYGFTFGKRLGAGAFGVVRVAEYRDAKSGSTEKLAVKIVNKNLCSERFASKYLPREMQCGTQMNHAHVVRTHTILQRYEEIFIFMQFVGNGTLYDYLKKSGKLPEYKAQFWFRQLLSGLQYMQRLRWCHRDIKVENVLVSSGWNLKIADFGFAKRIRDKKELSNTYCGTPPYSHPNIIGRKPYRPYQADMWSMGVCLFVLLENSLPFQRFKEKTQLHQDQLGKKYAHKRKDLSRRVLNLIDGMLEPNEKQLDLERTIAHDWIGKDFYRKLLDGEGIEVGGGELPPPNFDMGKEGKVLAG